VADRYLNILSDLDVFLRILLRVPPMTDYLAIARDRVCIRDTSLPADRPPSSTRGCTTHHVALLSFAEL
jgi:hypothetical protein